MPRGVYLALQRSIKSEICTNRFIRSVSTTDINIKSLQVDRMELFVYWKHASQQNDLRLSSTTQAVGRVRDALL